MASNESGRDPLEVRLAELLAPYREAIEARARAGETPLAAASGAPPAGTSIDAQYGWEFPGL
jgi:hypothetical protein